MKQPTASRRARRAGFTLVEITISAAVLGLVMLSVGLVTSAGNRAYHAGMSRDRLGSQAQRALQRIVSELEMAGAGTLTPVPIAPVASSTLTFRAPQSWTSGVVGWGSTTTIAFQYTAAEPNDGVDDDGDGFADEGIVVLTRDVGLASETSSVLASNVAEFAIGEAPNALDDDADGLVDERGLAFVLNGERLTVSLTLVARDPNGSPFTHTVSTSINVRN